MKKVVFEKNEAKKEIRVEKEFAAPRSRVWAAWTTSDMLDQWWGPKPWHVETKAMDFRAGGQWLYAMVGPEGEKHWAFCNYEEVKPEESFTATDGFCDENGNPNPAMPLMHWQVFFKEAEVGTQVIITLTFDQVADMKKITDMGFEEGFTTGLTQLDTVLAQ